MPFFIIFVVNFGIFSLEFVKCDSVTLFELLYFKIILYTRGATRFAGKINALHDYYFLGASPRLPPLPLPHPSPSRRHHATHPTLALPSPPSRRMPVQTNGLWCT